MLTHDTQGWDLVAAITQKIASAGVGALYDRGVLPRHLDQTLDYGVFSGSISMDLARPTVSFGVTTQGAAELSFKITQGVLKVKNTPDTDLTGASVTLNAPVEVVELLAPDGKAVEARISLNLKDNLLIGSDVSGTPLVEALLELLLKMVFTARPKGEYFLGTVDLSAVDVPDYFLPRFAAFTIVRHPTNAELNELLIMAKTVGSAGSPEYKDLLIPDGQDGTLLVSNERLLVNVVGSALQENIDGKFAYSPNDYYLISPTKFGEHDLNGAHAVVEGNAIHIRLNAAAMGQVGGGINIYVDSDTKITITYNSATATFEPVPEPSEPSSRWEAEWWVWLIVGIFGIIAGIIAVVVGELAEAAAIDLSKETIDKQFKGALKPIKWPLSDYVTPTEVDLPEPLRMFVTPKL